MPKNFSKTFLFFGEALLNLLLIVIVFFVIINLARFIIGLKTKRKFKLYMFDNMVLLLIFGFSFLGYSIGLMIGLSQSPVVHVAIPALLTFYGGFLTYLFAKDSFKDTTVKAGIILSVMAVSFFIVYGVEIGSSEKNAAIKSQKDFELYYFEKQEEVKKKYR